MLKELITAALEEMQTDCRVLTQQHYPTVHGQGMLPHHLTAIFERRLTLLMEENKIRSEAESVDLNDEQERRANPFRKIRTTQGNVWVYSFSIKAGNGVFKQHLLLNLAKWRKQHQQAVADNDYLVLIGDHWLSRNSGSQQLLDWWLNHLPRNQHDYQQAGIRLVRSHLPRLDGLMSQLKLSPCHKHFGHPLMTEHKVNRYLHLYAVLRCV